MEKVRLIDLFAGMGGLQLGFEQGMKELGIETDCVLTSEMKPHAVKVGLIFTIFANFFICLTTIMNSVIDELRCP